VIESGVGQWTLFVVSFDVSRLTGWSWPIPGLPGKPGMICAPKGSASAVTKVTAPINRLTPRLPTAPPRGPRVAVCAGDR
jgi:hypothetical protein